MKKIILLLISILFISASNDSSVKFIRLKYDGGGDWYNDESSDENLAAFVAKNTNINIKQDYNFVELSSDKLFDYPLIWLTGHGNIKFSRSEAEKLRIYLENGGFLYIDDDYGLDKYIREEMSKVFPNLKFQEIPFEHPIFHSHFDFPNGVPKIHEHDDQAPKSFGIFLDDRLVVFYTYESNLGDGWADADVHSNTEEKREIALKMGTNIIVWALTN